MNLKCKEEVHIAVCVHKHPAFEINLRLFLSICSWSSWNLPYFILAHVTRCLLQANPSKGHFLPLYCQELSHVTFLRKHPIQEKHSTARCPVGSACGFFLFIMQMLKHITNWFSAWVASLKQMSGCWLTCTYLT